MTANQIKIAKERRIRTQSFSKTKQKFLGEKLDIRTADVDDRFDRVDGVNTKIKTELYELKDKHRELSESYNALAYIACKKLGITEKDTEKVKDTQLKRRNLTVAHMDLIEEQDIVTGNFTGYKEDGTTPDPTKSAANVTFTLNYKNYIPALEKAFIGLQIGEKQTVAVPFPAAYKQVPSLAGKTFKFDIEVLSGKRMLAIEDHKNKAENAQRNALLRKVRDMGLTIQNSENLSLTDLRNDVAELEKQFQESNRPALESQYKELTKTEPDPNLSYEALEQATAAALMVHEEAEKQKTNPIEIPVTEVKDLEEKVSNSTIETIEDVNANLNAAKMEPASPEKRIDGFEGHEDGESKPRSTFEDEPQGEGRKQVFTKNTQGNQTKTTEEANE